MVFIGFVKKLNSTLFSKITSKNELFLLNGKEISYCELCGIVISISSNNIIICDFFGLMEIYKSADIVPKGKGPFIFIIKLYSKRGTIYGYCKNIRSVSIYEEISFNIEVKALIASFCY
ncbi:uncharacterized protein VICG_01506 [Vittaforma corneae ATCC 50505]|uniref:Uncharacterized protein n=1 Tax=Vittaforma corneae (strain ATCC 50505) TaxID=993615 RepID=L2GKM0_VITCO|nr:uncharacterized protein VICG_01506 [Vittaforma corneae ATCC 50505]ELA41401.1 hypothetical protein VICG_01506 [Vittaforma corneae ATCC 50505]